MGELPFLPFLSRLCKAVKLLQLLLFGYFESPRLMNPCLRNPKVNGSFCILLNIPMIFPYTSTWECCYIHSYTSILWLGTNQVNNVAHWFQWLHRNFPCASSCLPMKPAFINHYPKSLRGHLIPVSVRHASEQGTATPRAISEASSIWGPKM